MSQTASPASTVAVDAMPRTAEVAFAAADAAPVVAASTRARTVAPGSADRSSSNDRRAFATDAATPLDSFADVAAPLAGARGAQDSSSSGEGGIDHRAFTGTAGRSTASVDIEPWAFDVQGGVSAPAEASLAPAYVSTVVATSSDARVDEASTSASAPESIGTLAILASPTQLPAAFAELLAPQARSLLASASAPIETTAAARGAPVADTQRQSVAPKILTIELEPASLGAVVVKMKLGHSGIDMRISVESTEALRRLDSTRDQLIEAMQSSGCSVDSCTIQIGQNTGDGGNAQAASDGGAAYAQSSGAGAGRDEQSVGRQGAGYGGQGGDRRRGAGGEAAEPGTNGDNRRVADRRGGDLYL
ncbi:MAG TPA: flagellar hook-length control protein FliK [Methylosinus sp.]|uniref:flagellar hook-length control protein FliK n=1 Tax=Methylosinus sp. TaxID=427 RepID=UPI002F94C0A3